MNGQLWYMLLKDLLGQMSLIACSAPFPDLDDLEDESTLIVLNYLGRHKDEHKLHVTAEAKRKAKWGTGDPTEKQRQKAQDEQRLLVVPQYERFVKKQMKDGKIMEEVWLGGYMISLNALFEKHVKEQMGSVGSVDDAQWAVAMSAYWEGAREILQRGWTEQAEALSNVHDGDGDAQQLNLVMAIEGAMEKLEFMFRMREQGHVYNLPFPTKTFIAELYKSLKRFSPVIVWVSCLFVTVFDVGWRSAQRSMTPLKRANAERAGWRGMSREHSVSWIARFRVPTPRLCAPCF